MSFEKLKVKKWWGENASEFRKSPQNILDDFLQWNKQLVVVSAIRSSKFNTTDNLIELANLITKDINLAYKKIEELKNFHIKTLKEKIWENDYMERQIINYFDLNLTKVIKYWNELDQNNKLYPCKDNDYCINYKDKKISLIWFWEELSAFVQKELINDLNVYWLKADVLDLNWIIENLGEKQEDIFSQLAISIKNRILILLNEWKIPIIPWYIPWFDKWIENFIWRGYSDATASITAIWLSSVYDITLEIQKSVEWVLSADPRLLDDEKPKLIESLDYITAKEITWVRWSQAKLLHSQVLRKELLNTWIKIKLFDPFSETKWTIISRYKNNNSSWVEYIWSRDNIIFFTISSWDMSSSWILSSIFWVTHNYGVSVDIVWTSETEVSFTIDNWVSNEILEGVSNDIRESLWINEENEANFVKYARNKALIFCIGQNLNHTLWSLARASKVFWGWQINAILVSQGAMERSMVFGIESSSMRKAVNLLHKEFIN